jgi:hypothetical protein
MRLVGRESAKGFVTISSDDERLRALEKKIARLSIACWLQLAVVCGLCFALKEQRRVEAASSPSVLRAKGLVIEDSQGRVRVLLGSPLPMVPERIRQATTTSMVFLDEEGHDRLTLGEEPEPQVAGKVSPTMHRIAPGFGVVIHDGKGDERGTYGWLRTDVH